MSYRGKYAPALYKLNHAVTVVLVLHFHYQSIHYMLEVIH